MLRTVTMFYLLSMALVFVIAFWLALHKVHVSEIMTLAALGWPLSALVLLSRKKMVELGLI